MTEKLEYLIKHNGRPVIITDHVRQRARQRHGMPIEQMKTYFEHMVDGIDQSDFVPVEYNQEVFIYVRAFQRGCVVAFRRDYKTFASSLIIMTMYPYGRSIPSHPDTEVIYV